jgi:dTMP kinase
MGKKGLFITFEGIDGCGKTTQLGHARDYLESKGLACEVTREPGGTSISEKIRELLLSRQFGEMSNEVELLLYLASRAQHVRERILPAVEAGRTVLCDRFQEATFAYQGWGRGFSMDVLVEMNRFATGGLEPAHTFIFDIPVDAAFERLKRAGREPDRLEQNPPEFHARIREGYRAIARQHPQRISLMDACRGEMELAGEIRGILDRLAAVV